MNATASSAYSNTVIVAVMVPAAPTALAFVSATRNRINTRWTDNANNETGFYVQRSTAGINGPWTRVATLGANSVTYGDNGLRRNTSYWYRVQAYNIVGGSTFSNVLAANTLP